jgi:4-coumarate--CoA ligase
MPTIYSSPFTPTPIPKISVFNLFFPDNDPHANHPAFIDGISGRVVTRAQLQRDARVLAFGLRNSLEYLLGAINVSRHGTILVFSPNSMSYPLIISAALAGGIRLSLASSALMPPELAYQIKDSEPSHIAVHPTLFPVLLKALEILGVDVQSKDLRRRIILLAPPNEVPAELNSQGWFNLGDVMKANRQLQPERFDNDEADRTVLILYSSGTTGSPFIVHCWRLCFVY